MKVKEAYKVFSQALTALNSLRTLWRASTAIKKLVGFENTEDESTLKEVDIKAVQLRGALIALEFKKSDVDRVVKKLTGKLRSEALPDLLKEALKDLNKG